MFLFLNSVIPLELAADFEIQSRVWTTIALKPLLVVFLNFKLQVSYINLQPAIFFCLSSPVTSIKQLEYSLNGAEQVSEFQTLAKCVCKQPACNY